MPRTAAQLHWAAKMRDLGRCEDHGILLPCAQCVNNARRNQKTYYEKHAEKVKLRVRAYKARKRVERGTK